MAEDLTTGIVRILTADDTTAGTGFVVTDDGLIATCAHVVQGAGAGPDDTVRVAFHVTEEEHKAQAEIDWWRGPDAEDVAILRLEGPVPEGVVSLSLGSSAGVEGHTLTTFGFPDAKPVEGMAGKCEVVGRTTERGFPVLQLRSSEVTPGFSGAPVLDTITRRVVGMVTAITVPDRYGRQAETAFITPTETLRAVCPVLQLSDLCPYRGLAAFTEDHAEFFFGREKLVADLVAHLRGNPRFLAVVGPSGSGKSSVVRAGLFPALRRGEVPGSGDLHLLSFRPGADPFAALIAAGLDSLRGSDLPATIRAFLKAHPQIKRLVLFADQFEELFTLCPQPVQEQFLRQLPALLESNLSVTVVLTLRADFYGHLLRYRPLVDWLKIGQINVPPMGPEELRAAVEEPALRLGLHFEPGLVETIAEEAGEAEHPLPLLESALAQLWEKREDGLLTHTAYQAVGRVAGAIGQWAEDTYHGLTAEEQSLARRVFTRLVRYGEGEAANTRQRRLLSELITRLEEEETFHRLVGRLADTRLLVTGGDPDAETVEIIHDALLQEWGRLKRWVTEQREFYLWRQRLDERLQEWKEKEQDEGALLRGALLAEAERWLAEESEGLNPDERAYIQDSVALQERGRATRERSRRRITLAAVGAAAVFLILALLAWGQRNVAREAQATAEAEAHVSRVRALAAQAQSVLERHPQRSLLLATEAFSATLHEGSPYVPAAEQALREALANTGGHPLSGHKGEVRTLAISPDSHWLATGSLATVRSGKVWRGTVRLWDLTSSDPTRAPTVLRTHSGSITALSFSPDGHWLAAGVESYGKVFLWDVTDPTVIASPLVLNGQRLAFSPDSHWLATNAGAGSVKVWNLTARNPSNDTVTLQNPGDTTTVKDIAFSPCGHWLAVGNLDGTLRLWNVTSSSSTLGVTLRGHRYSVLDIDFSPDGRWLASASYDHTARLWDMTDPDPGTTPIVLQGHESSVEAVAISPDGRWLATGSQDNVARLWDLSSSHPAASSIALHGHEGIIKDLAFSLDGHWLATGDQDDTVGLWDLTEADPAANPIVLRGHEGGISDIAFSANGRWLATGSRDCTARLWDLSAYNMTAAPIVFEQPGGIGGLAISPDAHWFAIGDRLWDLTALKRGAEPIALCDPIDGFVPSSPCKSIEVNAFSPDGRWMATGGKEGTIQLWSMTTSGPSSAPRILRGHKMRVSDIAFSPDGRWLVSGSQDGTARLWDLTATDSKSASLVLRGHKGLILAVAFSPDGHWLVTGSSDTTARVWNLYAENPALKPTILPHSSSIYVLAISPDGHWLAAGVDGAARIWDLTASDPAADSLVLPCEGGSIDAVTVSPDGHWLVTANRLWDLATLNTSSEPIVLKGHEGQVSAVAFSPDSQWLVTGDSAAWWGGRAQPSIVQLWSLNSPNPAVSPIVPGYCETQIVDAAFSPDGHWLIIRSWDGTIHIWNLWPSELIDLACRTAGRNLTQREWEQYFPSEKYRFTCPGLPVPEREEVSTFPFISPLPTPTSYPSVISPLPTPQE